MTPTAANTEPSEAPAITKSEEITEEPMITKAEEITMDPIITKAEEVTKAPTPTAAYDWPTEFSLCETYKDQFLIGTIYADGIKTGKYLTLAMEQFNVVTPENLMKPEYMQRTEGNFNFTSSDAMMYFAETAGFSVVGHTLCWHSQSGNWLGQNVTREVAIEQLRSHITNIVSNYKGQIISWDVVNEAIRDGATLPANGDWTTCLRETQWLRSIGSDYLEMAFQFAHEADPDCKLYYNDYNLNDKKKAEVAYAMVKDFIERGIPIDGIGMQGHYSTDTSISSVERSLALFSELTIEVSITELDVGVNGASVKGLSKKQEIEQGLVYAKLFQLFSKYSDTIARVTFWGHIDTQSWRADRFPCIFNGDATPKLAAYAVLNPELFLEQYGNSEAAKQPKTILASHGTPVIDGEMDAVWGLSKVYDVNNQLTAWEGATGKVRVLWDEKNIYVYLEVTDNTPDSSALNLYEQDSVEVFLDQNNEKAGYFQEDDGQFRVGRNGVESFGTVPAAVMDGFLSAVKITDTGYSVELAIPLIEKGSADRVLGFEAQVNDGSNGIRIGVAKLNDTTDNSYQSTEYYANLRLKNN